MNSGNLQRPGLPEGEPQAIQSIQALRPFVVEGPPLAVDPDFKLGEYWSILKKRKWTVIATLAIVVTLVAFVSFRQVPIYEAASRIAIYREAPISLGMKDDNGNYAEWDDENELETQVKIVQSDSIALDVIKRLQLQKDPRFGGRPAVASASVLSSPNEIDPKMEPALLGAVHGNLRVLVLPKTRILEIRSSSPDPKLAADVANAAAAAYIEQNFRTRYESTMQTSDWLSRQLADLQIRVETAQEKLIRYQKENGIVGLDEKQNIVTTKLDELNHNLTAAEADRIQKEANYRFAISTQDLQSDKNDASVSSLMQALRAKKADLMAQYAQLTTQFGPSFPKVVELQRQIEQIDKSINDETKRISGELRGQYLAALQREKLLRAALENQKGQANELNEKSIEFNLLKRDLDTSRALYDGLLQKLKEAGVMASLKSSNVRIVDSARVPSAPSKPNIPRNLEVAFGVGLLGGLVLAFVFEGLDNTIRNPEQMQALLGLPSLGIIPLSSRLPSGIGRLWRAPTPALAGDAEKVELVSAMRPTSEMAECYRALRTSMLLSSATSPPRTILITSALPQEGKTTTCLNTAIVLAQKGARVLVIDADLRRPGVHRTLGIRPAAGLSTVLAGQDKLEPAILPSAQSPNLFVLPAGPIPPHPAELLASAAVRELLERCREEFDHVLIDSPPMLSVTDAAILAVEVDTTILVTRFGRTTRAAMRRSRDLLAQINAPVMGVVLNGVDLNSDDSYYYYYYYYGGPNKAYYSSTPDVANERTGT